MPIHGASRYKQVEPGKNVSHLTRVNSTSNSSKTIVPRKIIEGLNLRYDDGYLEWRMEMADRQNLGCAVYVALNTRQQI